MLTTILKFSLLSCFLTLVSTTVATAFSLDVLTPINEIVGTTSDIPLSGGSENFGTNVSVGDSARFRLGDADTSTELAQLEIVYSADNGITNTTTNDHQIMIAQTSNSQNLMDTGTISILVNSDVAGGGGEFTFNWFSANPSGISNTPLDLEILYTLYDIDFNQAVSFDSSEAQSITVDGNTRLTTNIDSVTVSIFDGGNTDSTIDEPLNAVQVLSQQSSSDVFNLERTSGSGNALYIFEFRDPSLNIDFSNPETISTVPFEFSPTLGLLISTFGGLSLYMKRRANLDTN